MHYRRALEYGESTELRNAALERALELAESERAKNWVSEESEGKGGKEEGDGILGAVKVPVVRLILGEVAEATVVAVLPVCKTNERETAVVDAPWECATQGEFDLVEAEKGWRSWVVLPPWAPVVGLKRGGVAVAFDDARALPWKVNRWYKEEAILVVADRGRKQVGDNNGFHLVTSEDGGLKVEGEGFGIEANGNRSELGDGGVSR